MRTKLFFAFLIIIITALISNLIYERLIIRDFEDYSMGMREDRLYWVLAAVEGSESSLAVNFWNFTASGPHADGCEEGLHEIWPTERIPPRS